MKKGKIDFAKVAMKTAGLGAGGIGAGMLEKHMPEAIPAEFRPGILILAGAFAPMLAPKQEIIGHIGDGMIAAGAQGLVRQFMPSLVAGFEDERQYLAGYGRVAGPATISDLDVTPQYIYTDRGPGTLTEGSRISQGEKVKEYTF